MTTPAGVIRRRVGPFWSTISRFPAPSQPSPAGKAKRAAEPVPSEVPFFPAEPAIVVTTPDGVIFRIVAFPESATNTFPPESTAMPDGLLKRAGEPVPSTEPVGQIVAVQSASSGPARVDTGKPAVRRSTFRMLRFWESAM